MRFLILLSLFLLSCNGSASVLHAPLIEAMGMNQIIIVGEGGTSGSLFSFAALTFQRENGGEIYEVTDGDDFVWAVNDFVDTYGSIDHLEYFGHGNNVALFLNQEPGVHGGLYANDPSYNSDYRAASIYELPADIFSPGGSIKLNGCNVARDHETSRTFAQDLANHFQVEVTAAEGPTQFSSSPNEIIDFSEWDTLALSSIDDVYMIPTYYDEAFVRLDPAALSSSGYNDVYRGDPGTEGVDWLKDQGVSFGDSFMPYEIATASDVYDVCLGLGLSCDIEPSDEDQRTVFVLKILMDAYEYSVSSSNPWYDAYVTAALNSNLMLAGFTDRMWMTREDLAYLSYQLDKQ